MAIERPILSRVSDGNSFDHDWFVREVCVLVLEIALGCTFLLMTAALRKNLKKKRENKYLYRSKHYLHWSICRSDTNWVENSPRKRR